MKNYNVKSNAKRFARGVAAKFPGIVEAVEPVETDEGSREWWPTVQMTAAAEYGDKVVVFDACGDTCIIYGLDQGGDPVNEAAEPEAAEEAFAYLDKLAEQPVTLPETKAEPLVFDDATIAARPELAEVVGRTPKDTRALAATLPPPVKSTPEEIAARRAARRQKIDADKAAGTFGKKPEKISKKKIILDLMKCDDGATQEELETATGWQRHTLRGYIAGTLRKLLAPVGKVIVCERGRGTVPTRYFIEDAKKEGGA